VHGVQVEPVVQGTDRTVRAALHRPGHPPLPPVTLKPAGDGLLRAELTAGEGTWVLRVEAEPYVVRHEVVTVVAA
jgi:nitrogen fixation protein FixH